MKNTNTLFDSTVWLRSSKGQLDLMLFAIAGVYLITEHTLHVLQVLPYAVMLLYPLMHLFMHRGHSSHTGHDKAEISGTENHAHHQDR
jgi:hypothetical protein